MATAQTKLDNIIAKLDKEIIKLDVAYYTPLKEDIKLTDHLNFLKEIYAIATEPDTEPKE